MTGDGRRPPVDQVKPPSARRDFLKSLSRSKQISRLSGLFARCAAGPDASESLALNELRDMLQRVLEGQRQAAEERAFALSLSRQLEESHVLVVELQERLETQVATLYLARSEQQRSAALADELRAQLHACRGGGEAPR